LPKATEAVSQKGYTIPRTIAKRDCFALYAMISNY